MGCGNANSLIFILPGKYRHEHTFSYNHTTVRICFYSLHISTTTSICPSIICPCVVLRDHRVLCVGQTEWQPLANAMALCLCSTWLLQLRNLSNWAFRSMFPLKHKSKTIFKSRINNRVIVPLPVYNTLIGLRTGHSRWSIISCLDFKSSWRDECGDF